MHKTIVNKMIAFLPGQAKISLRPLLDITLGILSKNKKSYS
jgi:hypothetical protein